MRPTSATATIERQSFPVILVLLPLFFRRRNSHKCGYFNFLERAAAPNCFNYLLPLLYSTRDRTDHRCIHRPYDKGASAEKAKAVYQRISPMTTSAAQTCKSPGRFVFSF